jgi:hypothetical protein
VSQGTVIAERPSSRPTIGAKAKIMMVSFNATWVRVKLASPSDRGLQTNTIAVQGAAVSGISPTIQASS